MFFQPDPALDPIGQTILQATWANFPSIARNQIAITWLVYDSHAPINTGGALTSEEFWKYQPKGFSYRGVESIYPASIVKLFYLVAVHEWLERGMLQPSKELERATRDMIIDSSNDATALVVDMLTGTTGGPELAAGPYETWQHQRNLINRYFQTFNWPEFESINVNQKTWCDGPYGRERQFVGELRENRNRLSTDATARLLHSIIGGVAVSPARSQAMMELMKRSLAPKDLDADPENQVTEFCGIGLPKTAKLWSKAGLTSQVRHDAAYIELDSGQSCLLVVFIEGKSYTDPANKEVLGFVAQQIAAGLSSL
jgi:hypothetical protein